MLIVQSPESTLNKYEVHPCWGPFQAFVVPFLSGACRQFVGAKAATFIWVQIMALLTGLNKAFCKSIARFIRKLSRGISVDLIEILFFSSHPWSFKPDSSSERMETSVCRAVCTNPIERRCQSNFEWCCFTIPGVR